MAKFKSPKFDQIESLEFEQPEFYLTLKYIQMRIQCCLSFNIKYSMPFKIQNIMALICFHISIQRLLKFKTISLYLLPFPSLLVTLPF